MKDGKTRLGFHRPDEMERYILCKAQRNAYLFLAAALLIWSLYESGQVYFHRGRMNLLPCLLLTGAALIQAFTRLALTRRAVRDDEDSWETGPLAGLAVLCFAAAGIAAMAAAAAALMGVRV